MKKKLTRIWGIGLTLILAASLLLSAAPVSAKTLAWGDEDIPEELDDNNIVDIAVGGDGAVIYVVDGSDNLSVSTDSGVSWSTSRIIDGTVRLTSSWVAVSRDDPQYLAVAGNDGSDDGVVYISDDGGATWDTLGPSGVDNVADIDVSVESGDNRFVAVAGSSNATAAEVFYYEIGAIGALWTDMTTLGTGFAAGQDLAGAVAFSPYFNSDEIMVLVSANVGASIDFQLFSFNQDEWNDQAGFEDYPVEIVGHDAADAVVDALDSAAIALAPDYLGSDEAQRIAFVAITTDSSASGDEADGLFRLDDDDVDALEDEENMRSVDFDGSLLVSGGYDDTKVYRSTDPLASDPGVSGSTSTKSPGGSSQAVVRIAGSDVVAGTSGDENAFSISLDNGATFNDISMINTTIDELLDVAMSMDGSVTYLVSNDDPGGQDDISVWRLEDEYERILSLPGDGTSDWIVRIAPDDPDVIYLAEVDAGTIYLNREGGQGRWFKRASRYDIADLAVETDGDVLYVLEDNPNACYVSKSTNSGFTWGGKETTELSEGDGMIASLGEDLLIVGSAKGTVSYSTDGNENWTDLDDEMGTGAVQVTASGLSDGDFIYASTSDPGDDIYRWEIGEDDEWDDIDGMDATYGATGIALGDNGALYVVAENTTDSRLYRFFDPTNGKVSTADAVGKVFGRAPQGLLWTTGSVTIWTLRTDIAELWSYKDTLGGTAAPILRSPADGAEIPTNQVSGDTNDINFAWESPSDKVIELQLQLALDSAFDELVWEKKDISVDMDEGDIGNLVLTDLIYDFVPGETYYWRMRVTDDGPVLSSWSETRMFTVEDATPTEPVIVQQPGPAPVIEVPPAPAITLEPPEIVLPAPPPPPPDIIIPEAPTPAPPIPSWAIYAIIIIGAVLVVALIVLIMRTRRPV